MEGIYTEEQAINITIEHGYDGAELKTSVWQQRGCLKPNRTLEALKSKLETIYNIVTIEGTGKKRKYILSDKKEAVSDRKFNYKGTLPTEEDEIMKEYIFSKLLMLNGRVFSYNGWAEVLGFIDTRTFDTDKMINKIKSYHLGFPMIYNPKEALSIFIQTLNVRNKDIVQKSFERLIKENRIDVIETYNVKNSDSEFEQINQDEYEYIITRTKEFLESEGFTYYSYTQSLSSFYKTKSMKIIIEKVEDMLLDEFDIYFPFKSFQVLVKNRNSAIIHNISENDLSKAYFKRLIKLTNDRQNKSEYKESTQFWKRFYEYNTLLLLVYLNVIEADDRLNELKKVYRSMVNQFYTDYSNKVLLEGLERRNSFG